MRHYGRIGGDLSALSRIVRKLESLGRVLHSMEDFGVRYYDYGVELSAPPRGVVVWALIREIGAEGLAQRPQFTIGACGGQRTAGGHYPFGIASPLPST